MPRPLSLPLTLAAVLLAVPTGSRGADEPPGPGAAQVVDFDRDVRPIFANHCTSCHGAEKQKGGLRLDRKTDALKGGDSGAVIVPRKPADSLLLHLVGE